MMMKKKIKEQEEALQKIQNKTTENKETANTSENESDTGSEALQSGNANKSESPENMVKEGSADKVVPDAGELVEKLAEMQDKYIRLSAEFDNYRKRTLREKMDLSKYAGENLILKIIPIIDDFERALKHMDATTDCEAMKNGIDLIYFKLSEFLRQNGIKEIESLNSPFNVDLHEAVAKIPTDEEEKKGKVLDVVLKGYYLQDKVLRFAKVIVGE
jgi:molecular chaperone GrpE